jgi:hypothetical protein
MSLRERLGMFVLTRQEQRTIAFIVLMVVLGLATKHYRSAPAPKAETVPEEVEAASTVSPSPSATITRQR